MGKNEEVETLDLSNEIEDKKTSENLKGESEENIKEEVLSENLEEQIGPDDFIEDVSSGKNFNSKKKKSLLFIIIILILLVLIALVCLGIYKWNDTNNESLKKAFREPALDYFDKYMSVGTGASAYTVTLKELKDANKNSENYDLKAFNKCDDEKTQAIIHIDYVTGEASDVEIKLSCKIF